MERIDCVVVGAGVVGLAVARAVAMSGLEVLLLEAESHFGTGVSSRNSEVIHAGIYYPRDSSKARLCVEGRHKLYDFCNKRGVPHSRCGKMIVATDDNQIEHLLNISAVAADNGVENMRSLSLAEIKRMEPELSCVGALFSPDTGIIDSHALMLALLGDAEAHGAILVRNTRVERLGRTADGWLALTVNDDVRPALAVRTLINCAGLGAQKLALAMEGFPVEHIPTLHLAKGNYFTLEGKVPFSRLIYPIPEPGGLGTHLTLDLQGRGRFGPDVEWVANFNYAVEPRRSDKFYAAIRRYWPELPDDALKPAYAGIRPKISGPGEVARDFFIEGPESHGYRGVINLFGIESPGLTSCLALGDLVADLVLESGKILQ